MSGYVARKRRQVLYAAVTLICFFSRRAALYYLSTIFSAALHAVFYLQRDGRVVSRFSAFDLEHDSIVRMLLLLAGGYIYGR